MALRSQILADWLFANGDTGECLSNGRPVRLPHTWSVEEDGQYYAGKGWYKKDLNFDSDKTGIEFLFNDCGNSWYKNSSGGNFTITTIQDTSIDGTKLTDGMPEELPFN